MQTPRNTVVEAAGIPYGVAMQIAPFPATEVERLAALRRYAVLDTSPELAFDEVTGLASALCGTPIALVSLVDSDRQWFKSRVGLDARETPRDIAFCSHAILQDGVFEVEDTTRDPRFADNPLVREDPSIRFYAGSTLITPDGHALGTLCVIDRRPRQLTDEQRMALRVLGRQVINQLELRQRVRELAQLSLELTVARDRALAGTRARDIFLANMSHELRTPLNAILGLSELMLETSAQDPGQQADLRTIHRAGRHLFEVVEDVLGYAQLELDQPQLRPREFDLCELLTEIEAFVRPQLLGRPVALECTLPARAPGFSDPTKIRQIVLNLLGNALKFTDQGSVTLSLTHEGDSHVVRVRDTGIGIAADKLPLLFAEFVQVHDTHATDYRGTGLGLAISRRYARLLGGDIEVESVPGSGSQFTARLAVRVAAPT